MTKYTHKQIYENRLKAIEYLKKPSLRKAREVLRDSKGGRCCLGHMCDALDIFSESRKAIINTYSTEPFSLIHYHFGKEGAESAAPVELVDMLGLHDDVGGTKNNDEYLNFSKVDEIPNYKSIGTLAMLNDYYRVSPQSIAKYLESVIMGGDNTPWIKIRPR